MREPFRPRAAVQVVKVTPASRSSRLYVAVEDLRISAQWFRLVPSAGYLRRANPEGTRRRKRCVGPAPRLTVPPLPWKPDAHRELRADRRQPRCSAHWLATTTASIAVAVACSLSPTIRPAAHRASHGIPSPPRDLLAEECAQHVGPSRSHLKSGTTGARCLPEAPQQSRFARKHVYDKAGASCSR